MEDQFDETNVEQCLALEMISKTRQSFFLTGRAGTGKTTFLKLVQKTVKKNFIVLAPTGVAAINAGGKTIHSFLGLPLGVLCPGDVGSVNLDRYSIIRHVDTIILDEVSMVRCDLMDAIDRTLRYVRMSSSPFGGVQMVFVGDLFQLEPVVTSSDRDLLREFYGGGPYYFYKSAVIERMNLPKIEFKKIYRQTDPEFIRILENIRTGKVSEEDLAKVNSRVVPAKGQENKMHITLTSTRREAQAINDAMLKSLSEKEVVYDAMYSGKMTSKSPGSDIAEEKLVLKKGAQVMFTKNNSDGGWVNGTLAVVESLSKDVVTARLESGFVVEVRRTQWESIEYEYDTASKVCVKTVVGSITQFPLRLAWAITIHKSQSLTFDRVAVDFGHRAFCNGQAYVALSRARSLEGLELVRPMTDSSVLVSKEVVSYSLDVNDEKHINEEVKIGKAIGEYLKNDDYDASAVTLYDMTADALSSGNIKEAYDLLNRCLAITVDDSCLMGKTLPSVSENGVYGDFINAVGLFYSGKVEDAEEILEAIRHEDSSDINFLYILSRCKELRKSWEEVESIYYEMMDLYKELRDKGLDSEDFRKFRYRLALLNEEHYGDPGAWIMKDLLIETPSYDPYHIALRWMVNSVPERVFAAAEKKECRLVSMMLSDEISDSDFIKAVNEERKQWSDEWKAYFKLLKGMALDTLTTA